MADTNQNPTGPLSLQEMLALAKKATNWDWNRGYVKGDVSANGGPTFTVYISPVFFRKLDIKVTGPRAKTGWASLFSENTIGAYSGRDSGLREIYENAVSEGKQHLVRRRDIMQDMIAREIVEHQKKLLDEARGLISQ